MLYISIIRVIVALDTLGLQAFQGFQVKMESQGLQVILGLLAYLEIPVLMAVLVFQEKKVHMYTKIKTGPPSHNT